MRRMTPADGADASPQSMTAWNCWIVLEGSEIVATGAWRVLFSRARGSDPA